ncbi:MAG: MlaE family lipid ABC transporter permease subunit [Myxococcota bacterium]|nr:ABC transporter permease [Myxococcales bacterium]
MALGASIQQLGAGSTARVTSVGAMTRFATLIVGACLRPPVRIRKLVDEVYDVGVLSLAIVCTSGLAVGMVLGLQGYNVLVRFGAESSLGVVVGLTLIRELGPVLTGLLVAGRAGSAATAEIGAMVATEQMDGLRMMSVDPIHYVVMPKAIALTLVMPLLSALFIALSIFGGYLVGVQLLGLDGGAYLSSLENGVTYQDDVVGSLLKSWIFGMLVGLIATYRGFTCEPNSAGVSRATTSTVVTTSVCILLFDYVITALWGF